MTRRIAILAMFGTVLIYGSNFAITRHATMNGLTPHDLVALRFGTAGLLLLPIFLRAGLANCGGVGWSRGLVLAMLSGAPMVAVTYAGLALAPAAHGAAIQPGVVTVVGTLGGAVLLGLAPSRRAIIGIAVVIVGLACMGVAGTVAATPAVVLGDGLFVCAGLLWGLYPVLLQRWGIDGITSVTVISVLSLAYLPFYVLFLEPRLLVADPALVLFHAFNQGFLNTILGLWIFGAAVAVLGAPVAQRFPPLIPVTGAVLAIPLLGEWPGPLQAAGATLIVAGLGYAAFGRPAPRPSTAPLALKADLTTST